MRVFKNKLISHKPFVSLSFIISVYCCELAPCSTIVLTGSRARGDASKHKEDKTFFSVYQCLPSPSMIMCCSPIREAVRVSTHYYMRALQTLIHGKECYIVIVIYLRASTSVYNTITEQCFETTGQGRQSH